MRIKTVKKLVSLLLTGTAGALISSNDVKLQAAPANQYSQRYQRQSAFENLANSSPQKARNPAASDSKQTEKCPNAPTTSQSRSFSESLNQPITIAVRKVKNLAGRFAEEGRDADNNLVGFWKPSYEVRLAEILTTELANTGHFTVVERENLYEVLDEQSLKNVNPATAVKKCNLTGAKYIIIASLSDYVPNTAGSRESSDGHIMMIAFGKDRIKVDTYIAFDLRVINTSTGSISHSRTIEGTTSSTTKVDRMGMEFGYGGGRSETTTADTTPATKALRAAMINTVEYLDCQLYKKDSCIAEHQALDTKRKESTKGTLNLF